MLTYKTYLATYIWAAVVEAGAAEKLSLDYYKGYDANFKPHRFFDHWTRMLELIPSQYIVPCSEMLPGSVNDRDVANYVRVCSTRARRRTLRVGRARLIVGGTETGADGAGWGGRVQDGRARRWEDKAEGGAGSPCRVSAFT